MGTHPQACRKSMRVRARVRMRVKMMRVMLMVVRTNVEKALTLPLP